MIAQLAFAMVLLVAGTAEADGAVVTAAIDPPAFRIGETATLTVTIEGRQSTKRPIIEDTADLSVQYVGPSSRVSIVNSSISSSVTHTFLVSGARPGRYEIGPIRVEIDGEVKDAGRVTVEIRSAASAPSPNAPQGVSQLTLTLAVPRTEVYLHERVPLALTLRIGAVRVDGLQYPSVSNEGFALESFPEPKQTQQQGPRGAEHVIEFNTWLTPLKQGPLTVGPVTMGMSIAVPRGRRGTFLGNMFGDEMKPIQVAADPVTLTVLPLPDAGRPTDFSGAVGKFTMKVTVAPREVTVGDPVTVTSVVRGNGSLDGIAPPTIAANETMRVYPVQTARSDDPNTRTFEQVIIPLHEGPMKLGGPSFSAFDPDAGVYRKLGAEPVALTVRASTNPEARARIVGGNATADGSESQRPRATLGRDLVFIKDAPGALGPVNAHLADSPRFWLTQLIPLGLWLGASSYDRRRRRLAGDTRYARFTRAGRAARSELVRARSALGRDALDECHDHAVGALRDYLAAKLDLAPGAVEEAAPLRLRAAGVESDLADEVGSFFASCAHARFAPSAASRDELERALDQADALLRRLERARRLKRTTAALLAPFVVGLALAAPLSANAAVPDEANPAGLFFRANALYSDEHYAEAAAVYETILDGGVESGAVYYNLGNAYFKAGDIGRAVLAYERARRLIPGDPDLAANLTYAREQAADPHHEPLLARVAFPLAGRLNTDSLLAIAAGAWWTLLLALAAAALAARVERPARWLALAAGLLVVLSASSAAYRYQAIERPRWAVVTSNADATVRYEPSANGTRFYDVKPGSMLRIVGERGDWNQVATDDGRRGWIETANVTNLQPPTVRALARESD